MVRAPRTRLTVQRPRHGSARPAPISRVTAAVRTLGSRAASHPPRIAALLRKLGDTPLPVPPDALRRGPFADGAFPSSARSKRLTSQLGAWLGIAFGICFLTGLLSHFIQHPGGWFWWPAHPIWLYRATQGIHVATGLASVPLLGAKLWSVYPNLFTWPPARTIAQALERGSIAVLVAAALFQITTGILNIARWYTPMGFFFTTAHYWTAWIAIGALLVHIAVQLPVIRAHLGRRAPADPPHVGGGLSRRGVLAAVATSAGVITLATVGETITPLSPISVLGGRRPNQGPQGLPVNRSAAAAGVLGTATDPAYRLTLTGPGGSRRMSLSDLQAMPQHTVTLPIACVEGWSASATWTGVRVRDLAALVGTPDGNASVEVTSLQRNTTLYTSSVLPPPHVRDDLTLLALAIDGEPLALDHGYPARIIAPNRPGVLQTKWVGAMTVVSS